MTKKKRKKKKKTLEHTETDLQRSENIVYHFWWSLLFICFYFISLIFWSLLYPSLCFQLLFSLTCLVECLNNYLPLGLLFKLISIYTFPLTTAWAASDKFCYITCSLLSSPKYFLNNILISTLAHGLFRNVLCPFPNA